MEAVYVTDSCHELPLGPKNNHKRMQASITKLCLLCFETKCDCGRKRRRAAQKVKGHPKLRDLPSPKALQIPSSDPKLLREQLVYCIDELRLRWSWVALIPARLGVNSAVDSAALSLCHAHQYYALGHHHGPTLDAALHSYSKSLNLLRKAVSNPRNALLDSTLATVCLVALFETIIKNCPGTDAENVFSHWSGIEAILSARTHPQQHSELTRSILYNMYDCTFGVPVSLGRPSPFEGEQWLCMLPAAVDTLPDDVQALQHSLLCTCTISPRLILFTRELRQGSTEPQLLKKTIVLLEILLRLRNDEAENSVLHRVKLVKNQRSDNMMTGPFAFEFESLAQYRAAILYWSIRLTIFNLYFVIISMVPTCLTSHLPDSETIRQDQTRWMVNLLMSWPYAQRQGAFAQTDIGQGCLILWQALKGWQQFKGKSVQELRRWLFPRLFHPLTGWVGHIDREEDLDVASEMLAGGPLDGFMRKAALKK